MLVDGLRVVFGLGDLLLLLLLCIHVSRFWFCLCYFLCDLVVACVVCLLVLMCCVWYCLLLIAYAGLCWCDVCCDLLFVDLNFVVFIGWLVFPIGWFGWIGLLVELCGFR